MKTEHKVISGINNMELNMSGLSPGSYIISVSDDQAAVVERVVVQ